jgi:hypothetical protein
LIRRSNLTYLPSLNLRKFNYINLTIRIRRETLDNTTGKSDKGLVAAAKYSRRTLGGGVFCTDNENPHTRALWTAKLVHTVTTRYIIIITTAQNRCVPKHTTRLYYFVTSLL